MSKKKLDELFDISNKNTIKNFEEFEKTLEDTKEIISKKIISTENIEEDISNLTNLYEKLINETREFVEMVKEDIRVGHFETPDQRTSLYDSASKLIDNLNRLINNIIIRENNLQRNKREEKRLELVERELKLKEYEIERKYNLKEKELREKLINENDPSKVKKLEQNNFYLNFTEVMKEIASVAKIPKEGSE